VRWAEVRKTSFCEQKEAKKLYDLGQSLRRRRCPTQPAKGAEVFWFFFSKKNRFLLPGTSQTTESLPNFTPLSEWFNPGA
jgi:hypothetical protein